MARPNKAYSVAFGGVLAALAVVFMSLGGLIPVATFVCPVLAMLLLQVVLVRCGSAVAWAWYVCVGILSALFAPDKETAAVFVFLGYYPIIKQKLDCLPLRWLWKVLLFNFAVMLMYSVLLKLYGLEQLVADFLEMGIVMAVACLALGNVTFFLLDRILGMKWRTPHG